MSAALSFVGDCNSNTRNWLAEAAEMRDRARVKALLASGTNVDAATQHGMTPLMYAALNGSSEIAQMLIDCGAQVNAKRDDGLTAIDLAAFFGQMGVVQVLLERGANPAVKGRVRTSAETWATVRGFIDVAETLRQASAGNIVYPKRNQSMSSTVDDSAAVEDQARNNFSPARVNLPVQNSEKIIAADPDSENLIEDSKDSSLPVSLDAVHQLEHAVTQSTTRGSLSVDEDVRSRGLAPQFRPGLVFLEKITSSWRHLIILTIAVMVVFGGATYGMLKAKTQQSSVTKTPSLEKVSPPPTEKSIANLSSTANHLEPSANPAAIPVKASTLQVNETKSDPSTEIELAHSADTRANAQKQSYTFAVFPNQAHSTPTRKTVAEWSPKRRTQSSIKIISSATANSDTMAISAPVNIKPTAAPDDEPQPAPLTVTTSRTRSINPVSSNNDARRGDQTTPLLSTKPKRKVIQWP